MADGVAERKTPGLSRAGGELTDSVTVNERAMLMNIPKTVTNATNGHLSAAINAGFNRVVPLIPVDAELFPGGYDADGSYIPPADVKADSKGKVPGRLMGGGTWNTRPDWNTYVPTQEDVVAYDAAGASCGLLGGDEWVGIDIDTLDPELAAVLRNVMLSRYPQMMMRVGQWPKILIPFKVTGEPIKAMRVHLVKEGHDRQMIEILGKGRQMVLSGTHPKTGQPYQWFQYPGVPGADAYSVLPAALACGTLDQDGALDLLDALIEAAGALGWERGRSSTSSRHGTEAGDLKDYPVNPDLAARIMALLPNRGDWDDWTQIGLALKWELGDAGWPVFNEWSSRFEPSRADQKYDSKYTWSMWRGFKPYGGANWGKIITEMERQGLVLPADLEAEHQADKARRKGQMHLAKAGMPAMPPGVPAGVTGPVLPGVPCINPTPEQMQQMALEVDSCNVMDRNVVVFAAIYKQADDPRWPKLLERAAEGKCLTVFKEAVSSVLKKQKMERLRDNEAKSDMPRTFFDVSDPNTYLSIAEGLERRAGDVNLAFNFGGNPVVMKTQESAFGRIAKRGPMGDKLLNPDGSPQTEPAFMTQAKVIRSPDLRRIASKLGYYVYHDRDGNEIPSDVPGSLIQHFDAVAGDTFKPMTGIVQHPIIWNGQLLFGDGVFHPATGLYLQTGSLTVMQWDDPVAAYKFLVNDWLGDFSFETPLDAAKAVMMTATMLITKTDLMNQAGPPIFMETAAFPGSGKTLRVSVAHAAITGSPAATVIYPDRPEEREKVFTTAIMEGHTHLAFDNLKTGMTIGNSHNELATVTTSPVYSGRILGVSKSFTGLAGLMSTFTGNNLIAEGDMLSRVVEIRHSPNPDKNLAERQFRHPDLLGWTIDHRPYILGALACILSQRVDTNPPGRFPMWSKLVAEPVIAVSGAKGFYDPWIEAGEVDFASAGSSDFGELMRLLEPFIAGRWTTAVAITAYINAAPTVRNRVFNTDTDVTDKRVSNYLQTHRDYSRDGKRLKGVKMRVEGSNNRKPVWNFQII